MALTSGVKQLWREADHSHPRFGEVKNERTDIFILHAFIACATTILYLDMFTRIMLSRKTVTECPAQRGAGLLHVTDDRLPHYSVPRGKFQRGTVRRGADDIQGCTANHYATRSLLLIFTMKRLSIFLLDLLKQ